MNRKVQPLLRAGMTYLDHMPIDTGSTSKLPCSVRYDIDWVVSLPPSLLSLSLSLPFIFYFYSYSILFYFFFFCGVLCHCCFQGVHMVIGTNLSAIALSITVCANPFCRDVDSETVSWIGMISLLMHITKFRICTPQTGIPPLVPCQAFPCQRRHSCLQVIRHSSLQ